MTRKSSKRSVGSMSSEQNLGRKMEEYMNDPDTPQSAVDAFWTASHKTFKQDYRQDGTRFQTEIPLLATGHSSTESHIALSISDVEGVHETVTMEGHALRVDRDAGEEAIGSDITLTREGEGLASFHMASRGVKIPSSGQWDLKIQGMMPLGDDGEDHKLIGEESGFYDIEHTIENDPDAISRDGTCVHLVHDVCAPVIESEYDESNMPRTQVHFTITKDMDQNYYLNNVRVACQYDGVHASVPAASCDPCLHDPRVAGHCAVAPVLMPSRYGFARHHRHKGGDEHTGFVLSHNTPSTHAVAGEAQFREGVDAWLEEKLASLPKDVRDGLSVKVTLATKGDALYNREATYKDTQRPLLYGFGQSTRPVTAITLIRLLEQTPGFNWQTCKDNAHFVTGKLLRGTCVGRALQSLYKRSCGLPGPTVLQLLTSTSGLPHNLSLHPSEVLRAVADGLESKKFKADEEELSELLEKQELVAYPGSQVHDSSIAWAIVAAIIRRLSKASNATAPITETAKMLNMSNATFVPDEEPSAEFGPSKRVLAGDSGLIGTASDADALLRSMHSTSPSIKGMKITIVPAFRSSQESTVSVTPGGWNVARVLSGGEQEDDTQRVCRYTTLGSSGWSSQGDSVQMTTVPDYALNVTLAMKRVTAEQCSDFGNALVDHCVETYKRCCYNADTKRHPPCVPVERLNLCSLPPYYYNAASCHRVQKRQLCNKKVVSRSTCHGRLQFSFYLHTNCSGHFSSCQQACHAVCDQQVELAPLIGSCKMGDRLRVFRRQDSKPGFVLMFHSTQENLKQVPQCVRESCEQEDPQLLTLYVVKDETTNTYRVLDGDKPLEHVHFYRTKSPLGNDVYAVQVYGITYANKEYVASLASKMRTRHQDIRSELEQNTFDTEEVTASRVEEIGASYVLPAVLGGLAAAGAGYVAGRAVGAARSPYYRDPYATYYDPYTYGGYYYNPYYTYPLWGGYGYGRYYPWWAYTPYYGRLRRPRPYRRRWLRRPYRVARRPVRVGRPGWRRGRRVVRRGRGGAGRRGRRRSAIGDDIEQQELLDAREHQYAEQEISQNMQTMGMSAAQ